MKIISLIATASLATLSIGAPANAQSAGNILGTPVVAAGGALTNASGLHSVIAGVVNGAAPTVVPTTESVTHATAELGAGVTGTGQNVQASGIQVGSAATGGPLVTIATPQSQPQGSVAALLSGPR